MSPAGARAAPAGSHLAAGPEPERPRDPRGASRAAAGCTVRSFGSIRDVPADEWDSLLAADDLQATHRFVRACEEAEVERARYRHMMVYQGGRLAAVASLCVMRVRLDLLSTGGARRAIRAGRRLWPGLLDVPVVFCGLPVSFGQSCLRIHPDADAPAVLEAVRRTAEDFAVEAGARVVCFKEFSAVEARAMRPLVEEGYLPLASLPSCRVPLPWTSFEEYLAGMRAGYRRQVTASLRARERLGITCRTLERFGGECGRIFDLYGQVIDRAEFQLERLNLAFFERLAANLPGESSALLVEREGELLAAAVLLRAAGTVTFLLAGIDYARAAENASYVHLVTEVVAEAIRSGAHTLEMGQTSYALKQRLGACVEPRRLFLRCRGALLHRGFAAVSGALFPETRSPDRSVFRAEAQAVPRAAPRVR
jgi:uncharacterized protein